MTSTDLIAPAVDPIAALTQQPFMDTVDPRMLAMFRATKSKGLDDAECGMALELARSLGLNPWANEFYAAKSNTGQLLLMVGRDGLLKKAEEYPDYLGYDCGVVYDSDEFSFIDQDPDGKTMRARGGVVHRSNPHLSTKVLGAWSVAERDGRPPRRFFARLDEYMPTNEKKLQYSPWGNQVSIMIEKVALSVVHRTLCSISGVYLREEVERNLSPAAEFSAEEDRAMIGRIVEELDADAGTRARLLELMDELNELSPSSWNLAKVQMTLPGRTEEELRQACSEMQADLAALLVRGRTSTSTREPENVIVDAVIVEDGAEPIEGAEPTEADAELAQLDQDIADLETALEDADAPERARWEGELNAAQARRSELSGDPGSR